MDRRRRGSRLERPCGLGLNSQPTMRGTEGTDLGVGQVTTYGLGAWVTDEHLMLGDQDEQRVPRLRSQPVISVRVRILRGRFGGGSDG